MEPVLATEGDSEDGVLLQTMRIPSIDPDRSYETVLWDSACSGIFVRHQHAQRMEFPFEEKRLKVTTLGGKIQEIDGVIYDCKVKDQKGRYYRFFAHGLDEVKGTLGRPLSANVMRKMFPNVVGVQSLSGAETVDYLIGLGKASWQPQRVQQALGGGDFWIWENMFGTCVGGSHPWVNSFTSRSDSLYTVLKTVVVEDPIKESLKIPLCSAFTSKIAPLEAGDFFEVEKLGTVVEPRCGACRCGRCPVPGSRYSYREEAELRLIQDNLEYDENRQCWVAKYP